MRLALALILVGGCAFDPHRHERPARFTVGATTQHFTADTPLPKTIARTTTSTPPATMKLPHEAFAMSAQFALTLRDHLYLGGEAQAGTLEERGSNLAGGLAVFGAEGASHVGSLAVEVAGGWRSLRYDLGSDDVKDWIIEPRVRGYVWLSSQITAGAAAGASLGDRGWMAGVYLAAHSNIFDVFQRP